MPITIPWHISHNSHQTLLYQIPCYTTNSKLWLKYSGKPLKTYFFALLFIIISKSSIKIGHFFPAILSSEIYWSFDLVISPSKLITFRIILTEKSVLVEDWLSVHQAALTGVFFVKLSRPKRRQATVVFSKNAVTKIWLLEVSVANICL